MHNSLLYGVPMDVNGLVLPPSKSIGNTWVVAGLRCQLHAPIRKAIG